MTTQQLKKLIIGLVALPFAAEANQQPTWSKQYEAAFAHFRKGLAGDEDAVERARNAFGVISGSDPQHPIPLAYVGAAEALLAVHTIWPWSKIKHVDKGLDAIDSALERLKPEHDRARLRGVPVRLEVQLVALQTFISIPDGRFHRYKAGRSLLGTLLADSLLDNCPAPFKAEVYLQAAIVAKREGAAETVRQHVAQVVALDGKGRLASAARELLGGK